MTSDDRAASQKTPTKPARTATKAGLGQGPAMTQKSIFSFFKTANPPPTSASAPGPVPGIGATNSKPSTTPAKRPAAMDSMMAPPSTPPRRAPGSSSSLFSTDESVLARSHASKRKLVDFDDDEDDDDDKDGLEMDLTAKSPMLRRNKSDEVTRSAKKFAAAVEKMTLETPTKKNRRSLFGDDDDEEEEEREGGIFGGGSDGGSGIKKDGVLLLQEDEDAALAESLSSSRRPSRGVRRIQYNLSDDDDKDDDDSFGGRGMTTPSKPPRKASALSKSKTKHSDDDDSEYEAPAVIPEDDFMDIDEADLNDDMMEDEDDIPPSPTQKKSRGTPTKARSTASSSTPKPALASVFNKQASTPSKPAPPSRPAFMMKDEKKKERAAKFEETNSGRYAWLLDIKDADKNSIGSPDYDPRTLYIPQSAWKDFTEFERQFWEIKGTHFDSVVFFKKGKFYELYENDADIGHQKFDLKLTDRTNMRMVGVPESSFEYWAAQFIAKGYKVARVDQMETALGKAMRERGAGGGSGGGAKSAQKVIRRELHSILTAGTLTDSGLLTNDMATYCMAIKEVNRPGAEHLPTQFGIAFVDTSTAEFNLATFYDDMDRTKFETLITQIKPKEVVVEKGGLSVRSLRILKNSLGSNVIWNHLQPESQFWDGVTTKDELRIRAYFGEDKAGSLASECWPAALQKMEDNLCVMSAVGGLVWYLRSLKLDTELLSFKNFHVYDPVRQASTLILDGQTLSNLEIFQNNSDGTETGTVLKLLNRCVTPFGKRLFRRWLCHPLRSSAAIGARLDAVEDLMRVPGFLELFEEKCGRFPDLERIVSRIHAGSCKISEFLVVLSAFGTLVDTSRRLSSYTDQFQSKKLASVLAELPDLTEHLEYFKEAFDHKVAATEGDIIPRPGFAEDYDEINGTLKQLDSEFAAHLEESKVKLKTSKVIYKDLGKEIYQLEVSNKVAVPKDWKKMSGTSSVSRYYNPKLTGIVTRLQEARETKTGILKGLQSRLYGKFDEHYKEWLKAVKIVAELDCLGSLSKASLALGSPACRPEFVEEGSAGKSVLELEGLRHPCVIPGIAADFIPNDTVLGGAEPNLILLTGPNMGGKSTLLRQTCVAIIMAQLGCYVPAEKCRLTPFDRIFTRIGANDNILAGQSTFMVELAETSKILAEATERSMVILDELGRGTSTFDGYAIAYSVLHELSTRVGCLGLFSTHYGSLTEEFAKDPNVSLKHMACQVDREQREVTFLYKLVEGVCEKSYGMNVAHMAGVERKVVDRAEEMAKEFEVLQEEKKMRKKKTERVNDDGGKATVVIGQGMVMDLAYLLSRVEKTTPLSSRTGSSASAMDLEGEEGAVPGLKDDSLLAKGMRAEQQTRVMQRILRAMTAAVV